MWRLSQNWHNVTLRDIGLWHSDTWHFYDIGMDTHQDSRWRHLRAQQLLVTWWPRHRILPDEARPVMTHTVSGWEPCSVHVINILLKHWHQQKVHHVVNKNKAFYGETRSKTFLPHPHLVTIAMNRIWFNDTIMNPEEKSKYLVVICHSKVYQTKSKDKTCPPSKN